SPDFNKLHEFYAFLAVERLTTTRCKGCGRLAWPPRGFCPECKSDAFEWIDLPHGGRIHGFTVQETGVPAGYPRPLVFAIGAVAGPRICAPLAGAAAPGRLAGGQPVRFPRLRVADAPQGRPRYLPAFAPAESAA